MPTKRLPDRPSVEHLKKQAKQLVSAIGRGDEDARARVQEFLPRAAAEATDIALADAQTVIAREYGFESWRRLRGYVDASSPRRDEEGRFAAAISAVVNGDAAALRDLLSEDPALATARASAKHRATLLHYVSANAVEAGAQLEPVETRVSLKHGLHTADQVDLHRRLTGLSQQKSVDRLQQVVGLRLYAASARETPLSIALILKGDKGCR